MIEIKKHTDELIQNCVINVTVMERYKAHK